MELQEFVHRAITQIARGIQEAQHDSNGEYLVSPMHYGNQMPRTQTANVETLEPVDFDIAIKASSSSDGKFSLNVVGFSIGATGGGADSTISRVKFQVMVRWPQQKV